MDARKLVGMTEGAKKRAAIYDCVGHKFIKSVKLTWFKCWNRDYHSRVATIDDTKTNQRYQTLRGLYRIGQRLRPCPGCADCDPYMGSYGAFYGGDPRMFTPDEECSTDEERALHKAHCDAWNNGARPTVKTSGIEWVDDITYQDSDGKTQTIKAGHKLVERAAYGLGVTRLTNDKRGLYCSGSGVLPAKKAKVRHGLG